MRILTLGWGRALDSKYAAWIEAHDYGRGDCALASEEMCRSFPELRKVRGWFLINLPEGGLSEANLQMIRRGEYGLEHWWCVTQEGDIVDPTLIQFDSISYTRRLIGLSWLGLFQQFSEGITADQYVQFREEVDSEPVGRCMCCGGYVWDYSSGSASACSAECLEALCKHY